MKEVKLWFDPPEDNGGNPILYYYIYNEDDNTLITTIDTFIITNDLGYTFNSLIESSTLNFQIHPSNIIGTYQSEDIYSIIYGIYPSSPIILLVQIIKNVMFISLGMLQLIMVNTHNKVYSLFKLWWYSILFTYLNFPTYSIASYLITN